MDHQTRLPLPPGFDSRTRLLALGGELKSSLCLIDSNEMLLTHAAGDLEDEETQRSFLDRFEKVMAGHCPDRLAIDAHPDYISSKLGRTFALPLTEVQHHHAHIAAVMADNGIALDARPLLGIALDGLGFGEDGTLWGGELLLADYRGFERLGRFEPAAMIGGQAAVQEPWRNLLAHLLPIWPEVSERFAEIESIRFLITKPIETLQTMVARGINAPLASSCGRLFDAVAALLGLHRERVAFEAEAAIALERLATAAFADHTEPYPYRLATGSCLSIEWQPMWPAMLEALEAGVAAEIIAARFHRTLIASLVDAATALRSEHAFDTVALSGGVFQNRLIADHLPRALEGAGFGVLQHRSVPTHDGSLALGQAAIAAALCS